ARRSNNGHATNEVSHEQRQTIVLAVKPMILHRDVLTLDVAGFLEAITECSGTARIRRPPIDESDDRRLRPLSPRRHRPSSRAPQQGDALTTFPLTEMHPIPSRVRSTSQAYRIAADPSAGIEGEPQGSPTRVRGLGERSLRELPAPVVLLFSLGHQP